MASYIYILGKSGERIKAEETDRTVEYTYDALYRLTGEKITDNEGNVTDTYVYDAWGNMISQEGETENHYLYCGEQQDDTTGLYYLRARYMSPQTGTFTSMDTYGGTAFDPVSLHKYLYANSNPVSYTDPSGYFSLGEVVTSMAISTSLGGLIGAGFGVLNEIIRQKIINPNAQFNFQKIKEGMLNGLWFGLGIGFLAGIGTVFACAFIFELLGAIGIFSGLSALVSAYYDWNEYHNGYLVGYDIILAIISFIGSGKSFQQADKISVAKSRAASAKAKSTTNTTKKRNTGGRKGNSATRALNEKILRMLKEEGYKHTNGVSKPEEYLPGPNNARKGSNWVDITVEKQNGTKIRINTVDTYADGTPTVREINAADSIN